MYVKESLAVSGTFKNRPFYTSQSIESKSSEQHLSEKNTHGSAHIECIAQRERTELEKREKFHEINNHDDQKKKRNRKKLEVALCF